MRVVVLLLVLGACGGADLCPPPNGLDVAVEWDPAAPDIFPHAWTFEASLFGDDRYQLVGQPSTDATVDRDCRVLTEPFTVVGALPLTVPRMTLTWEGNRWETMTTVTSALGATDARVVLRPH